MAARRHGSSGRLPTATPPLPPLTEAEAMKERQLTAQLRRMADQHRDQNLARAVALAQQAACRHGPLVEHFAELGRRYGHLLNPAKAPRTTLKVIEGGSS